MHASDSDRPQPRGENPTQSILQGTEEGILQEKSFGARWYTGSAESGSGPGGLQANQDQAAYPKHREEEAVDDDRGYQAIPQGHDDSGHRVEDAPIYIFFMYSLP
eukprot:244997-Amorphochlora_amoeboformis.AAC.1